MKPEEMEKNPKGFKPGDHVEVTGENHAQFGKRGVIGELFGVSLDQGKPRASILVDADQTPQGFIFVSLPNLLKI